MALIVDPTRFQAEGAWINWSVVARRLGLVSETGLLVPGQLGSVLQLRWMTHRNLGIPSGPFIVWRRPRGARKPVVLSFDISTLDFFFGSRLVDWHASMSTVEVDVDGAAGFIMAFAGSPLLTQVVALTSAPGGTATVQLTASFMDGLILSPGINVNQIRGIPSNDLSQAAGWEKIELVGLPVPKPEWSGVGNHATDQGLIGALTTPVNAGIQRLQRGAPPIGWGPLLDAGILAPLWTSPVFANLIQDVNLDLLQFLQPVVANFPPDQHMSQVVNVPLPPPENSSGQSMPVDGATTTVAPLDLVLMPAGTDPYMSLSLGFGTAYSAGPSIATGAANVPAALLFDYMITARWDKGLNGNSEPFEMAALVPAPVQAVAPPIPTNLVTELMGHLRPTQSDFDWLCSVRVSWDRPPAVPLFRPRTYAFARAGVTPAEPSDAVMQKRHSGGYLPITINETISPPDPEQFLLHAVHRELPIPSNPGWRTMKYAIAHQDIYGQWSNWKAVNVTVQQPPVERVSIVNAQFTATVPPSGAVCPASLKIEFLWDWRIRRPKTIRFAGRLYAASFHGDPPPDTSLPLGFQRSLGGGDPLVEITFAGDVPSSPAGTLIGLNEAGDTQVAFGPGQGTETRRYRITISNFSLNFAGTGHIGLALWAQGQERIPPQRVGSWSEQPSVVSISDPRPPVIAPDIVTLASLPDAAGECHSRLSWTASSGAAGYFVYESTETKILLANGLSEPAQDLTLSQRLTRIKNAFKANPSRREFTRRNSKLISSLSYDVTLPRGSTSIHVFIVLGVSAGQVEANWPGGPNADDALQAFAAPRVLVPAAPTIEAQSFLDQTTMPPVFRARVRIGARKGPRVKRIDLHRVRVDDAAKLLDTMGPPVQILHAGSPGWTVQEQTEGLASHIVSALGEDTPNGSWKRVWYRATAWSEKDDLRGNMAGKSPASSACWVVVPPADSPVISPLVLEWPSGGAAGDVLIKWSSPAPLRKTPVGPHTTSISATVVGAPPDAKPLIAVAKPLASLPVTQPATGSDAWRAGGGPPSPFEYRAIVRRAAVSDVVKFSVRITDPLGRTSEQLATIAAGPILPKPVLENFVLTTSVAPPGKMLTWFSSSPLTESDAGAYTLRVTVIRPKKQLFPPFGPFVPQPPITLELGLDDVPLDEPGPVPAGVDPLRVRRNPGAGPNFSYYAFCRVPATQFIVRLTSPDGQFVEHVQPVS